MIKNVFARTFERAKALATVGWGRCIAGRALGEGKGGGQSQADEDCSRRTVDNHNLRAVTPTSLWWAYKMWSVQDRAWLLGPVGRTQVPPGCTPNSQEARDGPAAGKQENLADFDISLQAVPRLRAAAVLAPGLMPDPAAAQELAARVHWGLLCPPSWGHPHPPSYLSVPYSWGLFTGRAMTKEEKESGVTLLL